MDWMKRNDMRRTSFTTKPPRHEDAQGNIKGWNSLSRERGLIEKEISRSGIPFSIPLGGFVVKPGRFVRIGLFAALLAVPACIGPCSGAFMSSETRNSKTRIAPEGPEYAEGGSCQCPFRPLPQPR
jgi:hypothetical protein